MNNNFYWRKKVNNNEWENFWNGIINAITMASFFWLTFYLFLKVL